MPLTHFPNGVSSFGMPQVGVGDETITTGSVFFVHSGTGTDATANGSSPSRPFATIDYAVGQCTANNGDIIFVMPGHTEAPATTDGIDVDVAGVWVRGLGWGDDRPTITPENAAVGVNLAAAGTRISNVVFALGTTTATVLNAIDVNATGCIIENCEVLPHATSQYTSIITADANCARLVIRNNRLRCLDTASSTNGMVLDGCDDVLVINNEITGHFSAAAINTESATDEVLRITIKDNLIRNYSSTASDLAIDMDDAATGCLVRNWLGTGLDFAAGLDPGNLLCWENYMADTVDQTAGILPATAAT